MTKTITPPSEANILKASKATTVPEMLAILYPDVIKPKPLMERDMTFEDVCEEAGADIADYAFPATGSPVDMLAICAKRNALISQVFNEGYEFMPGDNIYYAYHKVIIDKAAPRGFRLSYFGFGCVDVFAHLGARPGLKNAALATHVGQMFIEEAENIYYWHLKAISKQTK